jgi:transcriptional regulator with XRE-family HTH domain
MSDRSAAAAAELWEFRRAFGAAVGDRRKAANLSVARFAKRCRLSKATINKLERGGDGDPGLSLILILCEALETTPNDLLAGLPTPRERWGG